MSSVDKDKFLKQERQFSTWADNLRKMQLQTCTDNDEGIKTDSGGHLQDCATAVIFCTDKTYGERVRTNCPETCNVADCARLHKLKSPRTPTRTPAYWPAYVHRYDSHHVDSDHVDRHVDKDLDDALAGTCALFALHLLDRTHRRTLH